MLKSIEETFNLIDSLYLDDCAVLAKIMAKASDAEALKKIKAEIADVNYHGAYKFKNRDKGEIISLFDFMISHYDMNKIFLGKFYERSNPMNYPILSEVYDEGIY